MMVQHPVYPRLFKGFVTEFIDKPCAIAGENLWQQCYICGISIQFNKDIGKWQCIGDGLIRHKDCEPPPYRRTL